MASNLNKQQLKKIAIPIILIVGVVVVSIVLYSSKSPTTELTSPPTPIPPVKDEKSRGVVYDYEPGDTITILQGTIENIAGNTLTVKVSGQEKNPALIGKSFEVMVGEQTEIFLLEGPFSIVKRVVEKDVQTEIVLLGTHGQDRTAGEEKQKLRIEDLEIIDEIIVLSAEDIRGKTSFIAKEIYK